MTCSTKATRVLPQLQVIGALMLGATLTLIPFCASAQDTPPTAPHPAETTAGATAADAGETELTTPPADPAMLGTQDGSSTGAAAGETSAPPEPRPAAGMPAADASASMRSAAASVMGSGGEAMGSVTVSETLSGQLQLTLALEGLPEGTRAMHIHETGACDGPTFETAGGHLTGDREHGAHAAGGMHAGDLPNITVGADGSYRGEILTTNVTMDQIMDADGSAIIIHADADDYMTQPTGAAGDRIACGVFAAE